MAEMYIHPGHHKLMNHACLKIIDGDYEISVAFDDSCGAFKMLSRIDVRVYRGNENVTELFFEESEGHIFSFEELAQLVNKVKEKQI